MPCLRRRPRCAADHHAQIGAPYLGSLLAIQDEAFAQMEDKQILRANPASVLRDCLENHFVVGAFSRGELVGFAILYFARDTEENLVQYLGRQVEDYSAYANIKLVIVRPSHRGQGL